MVQNFIDNILGIIIVFSIGAFGFTVFREASQVLFNNSGLMIFAAIGTVVGILYGLFVMDAILGKSFKS